jgi:two-component system, sensor histidine kinase PdtaS
MDKVKCFLIVILAFSPYYVLSQSIEDIKKSVNIKIKIGQLDTSLVKEILSILPSSTHLDTSILYANKALKVARTINHTPSIIKANYSLSVFLKDKGRYAEALKICEENITLNKNSKNIIFHAKLFKVKGDCHRDLLDFGQAEQAYQIAISHAIMAKDDKYLSKIYTSIANMYELNGRDKKAIEYHLLCLDIDKKLGDTESQIVDYTNIAVIFSKDEDWPKVMEYALKAKALDTANSSYEANLILADAYRGTKQYDKAIDLLEKTVDDAQKNGETYYANVAMANVSNSFLDLNKNDEALKYADALDNAEDADMLALDINLIKGTAWMQKNNYVKALKYLNKAKAVIHADEDLDFKRTLYEKLSKVHEALGDEKQGIIYLKHAYAIKDSIYDLEKNMKVNELEKEYDINERTAALQKEKQLQGTIITQQRNTLIGGAIGLGLISLLTLLVYRQSQNRKLLNKTLLTQKDKIQLLHQELNHRVKNNLYFMTSLLEMQGRRTQNLEAREILQETENRLGALSLVHSNLFKNDEASTVNLALYLEELVSQLEKIFAIPNKELNVICDFTDHHVNAEDAMRLGLIINELVTNSIKHAFTYVNEPQINITTSLDSAGKLTLAYKDNGPGNTHITNLSDDETNAHLGTKLIALLREQMMDRYTLVC